MTEKIPVPNPSLTAEQRAKVAQLTEAEIRVIDEALISNAQQPWRKIAMVIALTMSHFQNQFSWIPDLFYAERVRKLIQSGRLESQGDLAYMRFCEVRLPTRPRSAEGAITERP